MRSFRVGVGLGVLAALWVVGNGCGSDSAADAPAVGADAAADTSADPPADGSSFGDGSVPDGKADGAGGDGGTTNASGCSGTQVLCGGKCVTPSVDPANCGKCGNACAAGEVCFSNACVANCPPKFDKCNGRCIDRNTDNDNCGGCGNKCAAGTGCVGGACVPTVPVGAAPAKCAGGGPPIFVPGASGAPTCTGAVAAVSFTHGLCSCTNVGEPALSSDSFFDAYDSKKGPYKPGGLGGSVGANGAIRMTSQFQATGDIRVAGAFGLSVGGKTSTEERLYVAGNVNVANPLDVAQDAWVGGTFSGGAKTSIGGTLRTPSCAAVPGSVTRAACTDTAVSVPEPCACKPGDLVPVGSIVTFLSNPANNDNALIGLSASTFDAPGAPARLDLPCGYYYLNRISTTGALTIAVHGPTALAIGGSIQVNSAITFTLDPGATLDVYVGGTVLATSMLRVGTSAYPSGSRFYVGGVCKANGSACALGADCCSSTCTGGTCSGGELSPPFSVRLTSNSDLNGLFYSANAGFSTSSDLEMYGAVFAGYYHSSSNTKIHYDGAATTLADECPPGGGGGGGGGGDGGGGGGGGGSGCGSCRDCNNQACIGGKCGSCTDDSQCCSPLRCFGGVCLPPLN